MPSASAAPKVDLEQVLSRAQVNSLVQSTARINVWTGAIRSGKTIVSLIRWLHYVATAPTTGRLLMVGRTQDTIFRNVFAVLMDPELFGELSYEVHYTRGATTAVIMGREVDVIGANDSQAETKLRGMTSAGAYVDEATLVPRPFWVQLLGRMSVAGAKVFATTNPDSPSHWLRKEYLLREGALDLRQWHFTLNDNPGLSEEYKQAIRSEFVGLFYRRFVLGHWVAAEGAIYDSFDDTVHVIPRSAIPQITRWISAGVDYGTTNPFAAVMIGVGVDGRLYVTDEYRYDSRISRRSKTDSEYSEALRRWMAEIQPNTGLVLPPGVAGHTPPARQGMGVMPEWLVLDPSAASFRAQLYADGVISHPADNSVLDGIRLIANLLARKQLFIAKSCTGLIEEMPGYSWDDKQSLKGEDAPIKVDDHSLDALRYALYTTRAMWASLVPDPAYAAKR